MSARETDDSEWTPVEVALARALCIATGYDPDKHRNWRSFTDEARPTLAALSAAGYAIVPVKSSAYMVLAALKASRKEFNSADDSPPALPIEHELWAASFVWDAMIAASQEEG